MNLKKTQKEYEEEIEKKMGKSIQKQYFIKGSKGSIKPYKVEKQQRFIYTKLYLLCK